MTGGQVHGRKKWTLTPLDRCKSTCGGGSVDVVVSRGQFLSLSTELWHHVRHRMPHYLNTFQPYFFLYEVISVPRYVLPHKCRNTLQMLFKLMELCLHEQATTLLPRDDHVPSDAKKGTDAARGAAQWVVSVAQHYVQLGHDFPELRRQGARPANPKLWAFVKAGDVARARSCTAPLAPDISKVTTTFSFDEVFFTFQVWSSIQKS